MSWPACLTLLLPLPLCCSSVLTKFTQVHGLPSSRLPAGTLTLPHTSRLPCSLRNLYHSLHGSTTHIQFPMPRRLNVLENRCPSQCEGLCMFALSLGGWNVLIHEVLSRHGFHLSVESTSLLSNGADIFRHHKLTSTHFVQILSFSDTFRS